MTVVRRGILTAGSLCLLLVASGCTDSKGPSPSPSPSPSPPPSPHVVLVVTYGVGAVVNHGIRPHNLAEAAGSRDCLAWFDPRTRGGSSYEVHLLVRRSDVVDAKRSIIVLIGGPTLVGATGPGPGNPITVTDVAAFEKPPTSMGPRPLQRRC